MESNGTTTLAPPKRILVGLDGSSGSERALRWAINIAKATSAEILAVHVFQLVTPGLAGYGFAPVDVPARWEAEEQRLFEEEWTAPLKASGVTYRTLFEEGPPASTLIATADDEHADLIVTGNRGLGGFRELMLGSVSQQVVLHANVPVVIIPAEHRKAAAAVESPGQQARQPLRTVAAPE